MLYDCTSIYLIMQHIYMIIRATAHAADPKDKTWWPALLLEPLKTMKSCPSHCETAATRQSLRKLRRERIRKGRAPAGFASKPLRNCNLKNLETLRLEPLKTIKSCRSHCKTAATRQSPRKLRRERIRKGRAPAGFASKPLQECFGTPKNNEIVPQPLRNCSHQAKPKKAASGAHPKKQSLSRFCVQAITGVQPQKSRNVAFGTPKNNEIVPQPLRNCSHQAKPKKAASGSASEKAEPQQVLRPSHCGTATSKISKRCVWNSHQAKPKKAASGAHPKRQSPSRFCVQAIAGVHPQKSRNVAFGTPKNNEIVPQPLRNCSHLAKPKKAASGAHPKNVAFGTPKNNEIVPQPLRGSATRQSVRKLRRERIRKSRAPAGFASKPLRNCSLNNLETLLLEPLKTMKSCPSHCRSAASKISKRCVWNP